MARAAKKVAQSPIPKERKGSRRRKQDDEQDNEPLTIDGVPIPEFLWDAPPRYHIFGA